MSVTKDVLRKLTGNVPEIVYHYCGPDGLLGILRSRHIWATSMRHLNDTSEQRYAAEQIRAVAKRIAWATSADPAALPAALLIDRAEETISYVACFSEHDDLLSQWRAYAPAEGGFAVGIQASSLSYGGDWLFGHCEYDCASHDQAVEAILRDHPKLVDPGESLDRLLEANDPQVGSLIAALLTLVPLRKHPGFSEEAEWRIVRGPFEAERHPTEFRVSRGAVIPYQCIPLAENDADLPIAEVVVGPSPDVRERTYGAIRMLLDQYGLKKCDLRVSKIPYRGW
jgi:Protein of unknown function (DUF2971)